MSDFSLDVNKSGFIDKDSIVSGAELKRLLFDLWDSRTSTCIRFRLLGEMWHTNHCKILMLTKNGVILNDETTKKDIFILNLGDVIQFELDKSFMHYQPHFHYTVGPVAKPC